MPTLRLVVKVTFLITMATATRSSLKEDGLVLVDSSEVQSIGKGKPWQEELAELYQHVFEVVGHITAAVNPKTCYSRLMSTC